jgi:hypothetical protein
MRQLARGQGRLRDNLPVRLAQPGAAGQVGGGC